MIISEELLYYVWQYKLFNVMNLKDNDGNVIEVVESGKRNVDSGPDFFNARIRIGNTLWAGDVEIHVHSSDYIRHKHTQDAAYRSMILHVVYDNDLELNIGVPVLELKNVIPSYITERYDFLRKSEHKISCSSLQSEINYTLLFSWLERLYFQRLENKSNYIFMQYKLSANNWEETLYRMLARAFGLGVNAEVFEMVAHSLPYAFIKRQSDNYIQVEAMLMGIAGLLDTESEDSYFLKLKNEFRFLKDKYRISKSFASSPKFMRMRPGSFPTIRLSQFSAFLCATDFLLKSVTEPKELQLVKNKLKISASEFWKTHFTFHSPAALNDAVLGDTTADVILINAIIPFIFVYGKQNGNEEMVSKALRWAEEIKPEHNRIVEMWKRIGIVPKNCMQSQALIELYNNYCVSKRCLECGLGVSLLKKEFISTL